jgi:hypothetical protein
MAMITTITTKIAIDATTLIGRIAVTIATVTVIATTTNTIATTTGVGAHTTTNVTIIVASATAITIDIEEVQHVEGPVSRQPA